MTEEIPKQSKPEAVSNPYQIGDPVVDLGRGRPMVVLDAPSQTVAEWSDANNYDLEGNYTNGKFTPDADEAVVECVYTGSIQSEPSKTYTFPVSRVALVDAHHADDGARIRARIVESVAESLFVAAIENGAEGSLPSPADVKALLATAGLDADAVGRAESLAKAEHGKAEYLAADSEAGE